MENYKLTIENGVITWIENTDANGKDLPGILYIPKEATAFSADAWVNLGCNAEGILVHPDNPVYSSAHNCLLNKSGTKLIKVCKTSEIHKLTGLKTIGRDAFQTPWSHRDAFTLRIPDGVELLDYRAFAVNANRVEITVPSSVLFVDLMAFMIHSKHTRIVFEGDPVLRIGTFGTAAEANDSGFDVFKSLPSILYPKPERITVSCPMGSTVSAYCKKYRIQEA